MKKLAWLLVSPLIATPLCAADLMQVYRDAQSNDPTFAAARATFEAGQEKQPQARAEVGARSTVAFEIASCCPLGRRRQPSPLRPVPDP